MLQSGADNLISDEPRRAPVLQRARQLGHLASHYREHIKLQITALGE
jgi:hypothetical protein